MDLEEVVLVDLEVVDLVVLAEVDPVAQEEVDPVVLEDVDPVVLEEVDPLVMPEVYHPREYWDLLLPPHHCCFLLSNHNAVLHHLECTVKIHTCSILLAEAVYLDAYNSVQPGLIWVYALCFLTYYIPPYVLLTLC